MDGNIPVIIVSRKTIPEALESAIKKIWESGLDIKTQYDKEESLLSKDATALIIVRKPLAEPRIYKNFPGGPEELEIYRQEVINGIHDNWINPDEGKWTYTYHQRLFSYYPQKFINEIKTPIIAGLKIVDQIDYIIKSLSNCSYTRRAQAITWVPLYDPETDDPPCLQRLWCRLVENDRKELYLNMNAHWRSRDLYRAWFMNVYALTDLQKLIADRISEKINKKVFVGRYVDISDSLHIYGDCLKDVEREVEKISKEGIENRVWRSDSEVFDMMTQEARRKLESEEN